MKGITIGRGMKRPTKAGAGMTKKNQGLNQGPQDVNHFVQDQRDKWRSFQRLHVTLTVGSDKLVDDGDANK